MVDQESRKQHEQIEDGEAKQLVSGVAIGPSAPAQLNCEEKEKPPTDRDDRAIDRPCKPEYPGQLGGESQEAAVDEDLALCCGMSRDNRQHRHARTRVVVSAIARQG